MEYRICMHLQLVIMHAARVHPHHAGGNHLKPIEWASGRSRRLVCGWRASALHSRTAGGEMHRPNSLPLLQKLWRAFFPAA